MAPSSGCDAIRASSGATAAASNPGMPSKCQYWLTSGTNCGTSAGRPARIWGLTFIDGNPATAFERTERHPRAEAPHVGIFSHQLLHERVVVFDITSRDDQHEITVAGHIPGFLDGRLARDPLLEHGHQLRPFPLNLDVHDQSQGAPDTLRIDDRHFGSNDRLLPQARDPALYR